MPNVRIYIERGVLEASLDVPETVRALRASISREMNARADQCHVVLIPVHGAGDQAACYVDMDYRPSPERTPSFVETACLALKTALEKQFGVRVRIRARAQDLSRTVAVDSKGTSNEP